MKSHLLKLAAIGALAVGMAFAQTPATTARRQGLGRLAARPGAALRLRVLRALNLSDAQKAQFKTIRQQTKQSVQPVRDQLKANRQAMAVAVKANDATQIQQLAATQGSLQGQVLAIRMQAQAKMYNSLTPDQRAKLDQIRQKIQERRQLLRQPIIG